MSTITTSFQKRPGNCGNFAIVEVFSMPQEWIQPTGGGHTAIGRVTANGGDTVTLKLYAVREHQRANGLRA
jgi:hypothetical protein